MTAPSNWERGEEYTHFWLNRMAHDSPRPIQERMSLFWHGHFCSDLSKVDGAELMQQQIDGFRRDGMGNLRSLAKQMSTQVAMIRYLDNNDNRKSSPNQNFGRELLELFLLGVGNYTEADVEASTAAWTGHTDNWETDAYVWRADWHDNSNKSFLGATINLDKTANGQKAHGYEVIDVVLGAGKVPMAAVDVANRGRDTRLVAAEFLSRKLWTFFAGTDDPGGGADGDARRGDRQRLRDQAVAAHDAAAARVLRRRGQAGARAVADRARRRPAGGERQALRGGHPAVADGGHGPAPAVPAQRQRLEAQRLLRQRQRDGEAHRDGADVLLAADGHLLGRRGPNAGVITLPGGTITRTQIVATGNDMAKARKLVDDLLVLMRLTAGPESLAALYTFSQSVSRWERADVLLLIMLMPELHVA